MNQNLFEPSDRGSSQGSGECFTAHCDGGSRGNPGPSGYGAVIEDPQGRVAARLSEFLGIQTNNYAEYSGLLAVLKWGLENGAKRLKVVSDSELMVKQMKGQYKVASPVLRPLWEDAKRLSRQFEKFEMSHTLRGGNKEADRLANDAMDRGMGKTPGGSGASSGAAAPRSAGGGAPSRGPSARPGPGDRPTQSNAPKPPRQVLEGYVKNGVVHLLEGELPDGIFVKVVRE